MHIEDFVEEVTYVLRAELPGLDATKDIDVSATDGTLTVTLPAGADTSKISAEYWS